MSERLVKQNGTCDFPGCDRNPSYTDKTRCLVHKDVKISASYLNGNEVEDE